MAARTEVHAHAVAPQRRRWSLLVTGTKPGSTPIGLEEAHRDLLINPEFDEVAAILLDVGYDC